MSDRSADCLTFAAELVAAEAPSLVLPATLPCAPLDLLVALHAQTTSAMLVDLARAGRAAAAARLVASRFPTDLLLQAQAHWTQGTAVMFIPDYARALEHYDQALSLYAQARACSAPAAPARDIRIVQIPRVGCLTELGRYHEALEAVEQAERWLAEHPNDYARLVLLLNRSMLAGSMGAYEQMIELTEAMLALAEPLEHDAMVAKAYINRAFACISLGRFAEAALVLDQGEAAALRAEEPITIARAQCNRARLLHGQGQLFAALRELRVAQRGFEQASGEAATIALEEAVIYEQLYQWPEALQAARTAAGLFAAQGMPTYSAVAALQAVRIAVEQRQTSTAQRFLELAREQVAQSRLPVLEAQLALAEASVATLSAPGLRPARLRRQRSAARSAARCAVELLETNGLLEEASAGRLVLAALEVLLNDRQAAIASYQEQARTGNGRVRLQAYGELGSLLPPAEALPQLRCAVELAIEQRRLLPMEELQARYSSETSPYHMRLAACYLTLGDPTRALETIWSAKAGPLLDLRAAAGVRQPELYGQLEGAKATLQRLREQAQQHSLKAHHAAQQGQRERADYHSRRAQALTAELHSSEQRLSAAVRTLGDRNGQARVPGFDEVQRALAPATAILEYAECAEQLICFVVQAGRPPIYRELGRYQAVAPLLDRWSLICHRLIQQGQSHGAERQLHSVLGPLWDALLAPVAPVLGEAQHLLIAPCGMLHHVPWAALWTGSGCLGEGPAISLTPSAAMWAAPPPQAHATVGPPRLLAYAGSGAEHLPHAAGELQAIAQHLPGAQICSPASAADLRAGPAPRVLHIAAHGHTNAAAPLCSALQLADGPFLLLEAYRLDLCGTQLVALSACDTSVRPNHGDMALALAGAFLCAGSQSVLASLWPVSDGAAARLMERFYAALSAGASPSLALQQAQQQMRSDDPLDWAAFQLWAGAGLRPTENVSSSVQELRHDQATSLLAL